MTKQTDKIKESDGCIGCRSLESNCVMKQIFTGELLEFCPCSNCLIKGMCIRACDKFTKLLGYPHQYNIK